VAPAPRIARLTESQFRNSVEEIFGEGLVLSGRLDADSRVAGSVAIGARENAMSRYGVQQTEAVAFDVMQQALELESARARLIACSPAGPMDEDCLREVVSALARRAWRREASEAEVDGLVALGLLASARLGNFDAAVEFAGAAILESPDFLYRVELGEIGEDGVRRYSQGELGSRLAFFLWDSTPDDALLDAALGGGLSTDAGLADQVTRMLESPKARRGVRALFSDMLDLDRLSSLSKDPGVFTQFSTSLGPSAREETLRLVEHWVFEIGGDYRDLFTTPVTFLNRELAAVYNVRAPRDDWGMHEFEESDRRVGLLGHASFLAPNSHPRGTSATLRGMFVRRTFLCEEVPAPPVNVDTSLPEPSGMTLTLRDRVQEHLNNESCAGCHRSLDLIGLTFENFDSIGVYRTTDNGAMIDASGALDGLPFNDAPELAALLHDDPRVTGCFVRKVLRYATGRLEEAGQQSAVRELQRSFSSTGYNIRDLMFDVATSRAFHEVGEVVR